MNDSKNKKSGFKEKIISVLTIVIIILFLGIFIGIIYSLIELIPIPPGFDTKWIWYGALPSVYPNACPWGLKILIFGGLMGCFFIGLTISIYIWKKGRVKLFKWFYGESIE